MSTIAAAVVFAVSLLIGTVAILVGARLIIDSDAGVTNAALTALIGAIAWAGSSLLVGWVPLVGVIVMLLIWIGVINWRYPGGWESAAAVGFVAWIVAVVIVYALSILGLVSPGALGVPGA